MQLSFGMLSCSLILMRCFWLLSFRIWITVMHIIFNFNCLWALGSIACVSHITKSLWRPHLPHDNDNHIMKGCDKTLGKLSIYYDAWLYFSVHMVSLRKINMYKMYKDMKDVLVSYRVSLLYYSVILLCYEDK